MKLYNTAERRIEPILPINVPTLTIYTCGPTVYLDPHIGNWRMFIFYDTLVRTLRGNGLEVVHVLNLTDVGHLVSDSDSGQDKLDKTAKAQNKTAWDIAEHYIGVFKLGMDELNNTPPSKTPRATDYMDQQIEMIKSLEEKGFTYKIDDGIYFDTSKFPTYGQMARLNIDGQEDGARVEQNTEKRNPSDFALWKFSPLHEKRDMEWGSPWGVGFPGWHLECSAMANSLLGKTIDIHAGGIDHIPIHHSNEIAQSEASSGQKFASTWVHGSFMNVDGKKMSKSLGNVYSLEDLKQKGFAPLDFRMLVIQAHYRTHQNFTWNSLMGAQSRRKNIQALADRRFQANDQAGVSDLSGLSDKIIAAMRHDLNTPKVLELISQLEHIVEKKGLHTNQLAEFKSIFTTIDSHLGLNFLSSSNITDNEKSLINQRAQARDSKNWDKSDELRDQLRNRSIEVNDTVQGPIWTRI